MPARKRRQQPPATPEKLESLRFNAERTVRLVGQSSVYKELVLEGERGEHKMTGVQMLGLSARRLAELANLDEQPLSKVDRKVVELSDELTLMAKLRPLVGYLQTLRERERGEYVPHKVYEQAITRGVEFNHALLEVIEANPTLRTGDVTAYLRGLHDTMSDESRKSDPGAWQQEKSWFEREIDQRVRGMQHEHFTAQIIDTMPGYQVDTHVSVSDDREGTDLYAVNDTTGVRFPLDIKASRETADRARERSPRPEHIVWSGIATGDVNGRFRLTPEEITAAQEHMQTQLEKAEAEHRTLGRNLGRVAAGTPNYTARASRSGKSRRRAA